ncbi:unnamed protein product, partial [Mesorhabditis belari]|uniref:Uncharacterized protein n=1 Tax=Mesorhabditis belari TaxID=2138241 RepID=A0AAF3EQ85_9BILA
MLFRSGVPRTDQGYIYANTSGDAAALVQVNLGVDAIFARFIDKSDDANVLADQMRADISLLQPQHIDIDDKAGQLANVAFSYLST